MTASAETRHRKPMSYEAIASLFLSLYRFFTYLLAVLLIQVVPLDTPRGPDPQVYVILGLVALYTLLKVFSPLLWQQRYPMTHIVLGVDAIACILLLMFTGGLDSGFLLYALTPLITASLLFKERVAFVTAGLLSIPLVVAHLALSNWTTDFAWIMRGNYLPLLVVYVICCFLIAILTYRTNMNIRQRIETAAVLEERMRIRRELHDGVAQALGYLNMKTKTVSNSLSSQDTERALAGLQDIQKVVKDTYEDIRQSIDSLSETRIFPLVPTLSEYVQEFGERNDIDASFEAPQAEMKLSNVAELQLLRIAHEAMNNARKHAQASKIFIRLGSDPSGIEMMVKDNGLGFSFEQYMKDSSGHHGLVIMKERAESLGGTCDISSDPGQGTEIRVNIPAEKVRL
jgi:signal transduction histidine kinase